MVSLHVYGHRSRLRHSIDPKYVPLPELPNELETALLSLFEMAEGVPEQLGTHHEPLFDMLETICEQLDIELILMSGDEPYFTELVEAVGSFRM